MPRRRRLIVGGIIVLVVALALLGAYAMYHHKTTGERLVHPQLYADRHVSPVSCTESAFGYADVSSHLQTTVYQCTSEAGLRIADVKVHEPFGRTAFAGRHLSGMVAEESR